MMRSFQFKLYLAFSILIMLTALPLALTWRGLNASSIYSERSERANEVLAAHLMLSERGQRLLRHVQSPEARPGDVKELALRDAVDTEVARARLAITNEVAAIGEAGAAEEYEELARLDAISRSLMLAVENDKDQNWRLLVKAAVDEEKRELAIAKDAQKRIDRGVRTSLFVDGIGVILVGAILIFWLQRQVQVPLNKLLAGTRALREGKLDYRIDLNMTDEFGRLGNSFDAMAADLERQRREIEEAQDNLERQVASRTAALAEANSQLVEAADRRRQFLADISHELRTPLAIIRGEAEVTMRSKPDLKSRDFALGRIAEHAQGMGRLVDDLLFVARTEAGEPKLKLKKLRFRDLLEEVVEDARVMLVSSGGTIELDSGNINIQVTADRDRLKQLILILLDNAIQYSQRSPEITIELSETEGGLMFRVHDRGIGISNLDLPHIFDRFRRGKNAEVRNGNGFGLGLPLAKSIVEGHGGKIAVESVKDHGTDVSVYLPCSGHSPEEVT